MDAVLPSVVPQPVAARLTRAAIFLVVTLEPGLEAENAARKLFGNLSGLLRAVGFRDLEGGLSGVLGIGSDAWDRLFGAPRPKADAMVTNVPGIAIGALSADCGPVLFADHAAGVIGSAHAGWRGAFTGVLENTVEAMIGLGARRENIVAVLGPTIGPDNYEVGPEFFAEFTARDPAYARYFRPSEKDGHRLFDLWTFITDRLAGAGVQAEALRRCTYAEEDLFYSYRRNTHRREPDYGRQIAAIAIVED